MWFEKLLFMFAGGMGVAGAAAGGRDHVLHRVLLPAQRATVPYMRHRRTHRQHLARHQEGWK